MCFSATASFAAGAVLSVIGTASIKKAQHPSQIPFAAIPFLFAVQQITEGFVWLSLINPGYEFLREPATYIFIFFAQVVWPAWVPLSIYLLESEKKRKKILMMLVAMGAVLSLYLAYCLLSYSVTASAMGGHISYKQEYPANLALYGGAFYMLATIGPPFFSTVKRTHGLAVAVLLSYLITAVFYRDYIVSVWCFFASVISIVVFAVMQKVKEANMPARSASE
ncbi:MAG TPA: DUF6629 family protein [Bacteroidia bacterium]|nr:DUF6629 family protein [Bacteroidia bacterium]